MTAGLSAAETGLAAETWKENQNGSRALPAVQPELSAAADDVHEAAGQPLSRRYRHRLSELPDRQDVSLHLDAVVPAHLPPGQRAARLSASQPGTPDEPGDRVATIALNHNAHLELYYGVSCCGAVLHPINMRLSQDHMVYTITHAEDKVLFFDDVFLPLVEQIYDRIKDTVEKFVYISDEPGRPESKIENLYSYEDLIADASAEFDWPMLHEDTYATLCYTTGTTGLPKGVMFSHRALYLETIHLITLGVLNNDPERELIGEAGVSMLNIPLFHIHGWGAPYMAVFAATQARPARRVHRRGVLRARAEREGRR